MASQSFSSLRDQKPPMKGLEHKPKPNVVDEWLGVSPLLVAVRMVVG